ncbi:LysR family transcriptional regulator [Sutcliffiella halmapala]|uniref:LysR family transcriptional regulator n=1 Tax=Sutcliffiella halmapala TaxID=79882 RepID=UPI000995D700|nr:LysR family transcriptional regulator [Sutcliffiella halmapala]
MDFNWLRTFVIAASNGNFRKTAELLYISQPTVTVHIKQLEKEIGATLFQRDGRNILLTEEGRRYFHHAKKLLEVYESGVADLHSYQQGYTSNLAIAISPLIADTILPYVLKRFITKYPQVEISVKIIESKEIEQAILHEEVDIGLSCLPNKESNIFCQHLYHDPLVLVAPHDGFDAESAIPLDEEEILTSNTLMTHNHPVYWDELCQQLKVKYPTIKMMKVSQIHITKRFIIEGLGVSILPMTTVRRELLEGRLLEVQCHSITFPEAKTYALMKYEHSIQKEFLQFLGNFRI